MEDFISEKSFWLDRHLSFSWYDHNFRNFWKQRERNFSQKFPHNPPKCTSPSSLRGYVHHYLSKAIISLPTQAGIVDLFAQTFIGGLNCVNTWLSFDSKILLPKNPRGQPKENLKLIYKLKNDMKNIFENKRVVTKILKMDGKNQYGNAMTK